MQRVNFHSPSFFSPDRNADGELENHEHIQLYAKLSDLTPTEPLYQIESFAEYGDWRRSIVFDGIQYQLNIYHDGRIHDGNARFWIARRIGLDYVPINVFHYLSLELPGVSNDEPRLVSKFVRPPEKLFSKVSNNLPTE